MLLRPFISYYRFHETLLLFCLPSLLLVSLLTTEIIYRLMTIAMGCHNVLIITHSLTHGDETFLRRCQLCRYLRNSQHFMELEGFLQCSKVTSTGLYHEPYQSNPYHPIISF
jgi:hypothetical protein